VIEKFKVSQRLYSMWTHDKR